ncbi:hypothetical protein TNCV_4218451 [Trichonephila clavipes]|nr:hypothetical protein TNCV_4218451 [Trichonephila clavipes]
MRRFSPPKEESSREARVESSKARETKTKDSRGHRAALKNQKDYRRSRGVWGSTAYHRTSSGEGASNLGGRTGKILRPSSVALKSKNQEINRLQLAVKLPWAIFFESVDILS